MTEPTTEPTIRLYDTMRREKVEFRPIDPGCVRMYVCGPTVYDYAHIGNARPAIVFDVLFRLLRHVYGAENVVYVRNITDVDDKIIERAQRDYPGTDLNEAIRHVTETTTKQYQDDMAALGCLPPTHEPRATENIPQMIALVEDLLRRGHAYEATGEGGREVLFDVTSMPDYGALSNREERLDEQIAGARVAVDSHKRDPGDFVLWKEAKGGEPGWDSPFGRGRPGWHLECSAMSHRFLWEELRYRLDGKSPHVFDIHGGGLDLIFPHHENEIAQSCCAYSTDRMANVWMHNGYLELEGAKMSKSEGNFITIHDLLHTEKFGGKKWSGEVLRLAMLMTHYRKPIDFSVRRLEEAEDLLEQVAFNDQLGRRTSPDYISNLLPSVLYDILRNDMNTPSLVQGIRMAGLEDNDQLVQLMDLFGVRLRKRDAYNRALRSAKQLSSSIANIARMDRRGTSDLGEISDVISYILGQLSHIDINQHTSNKSPLWESDTFAEGREAAKYSYMRRHTGRNRKIVRLIALRQRELANRNFAEADRIRDELAAEGIQLMDYKDPETGERRTKWEVKR